MTAPAAIVMTATVDAATDTVTAVAPVRATAAAAPAPAPAPAAELPLHGFGPAEPRDLPPVPSAFASSLLRELDRGVDVRHRARDDLVPGEPLEIRQRVGESNGVAAAAAAAAARARS